MGSDYYKTLGVDRNSTESEIQQAYRNLARKYHPDVSKESNASEKFKEISEAYSVIGNPEKKRAYDRTGQTGGFSDNGAGFSGGFGEGFGGGFEDIFGFGGFEDLFRTKESTSSDVRGKDVSYKVDISLEEAFFGKKINLSYDILERCISCKGMGYEGSPIRCSACDGKGTRVSTRGMFRFATTCNVCEGTGMRYEKKCKECIGRGRKMKRRSIDIEIPRGVRTGATLKREGMGEGGVKKGRDGDLYINITINRHNIFSAEGSDLNIKQSIDLGKLVLGGEILIKGINKELRIQVPEGNSPNKILKIKGEGMYKDIGSNSRGDLNINFDVIMPTISGKNRDLFKKAFEI